MRNLALLLLLFAGSAFAATPTITDDQTSTDGAADSTQTITLPSPIAADDLLLCVIATDGTGSATATHSWPGSWNELVDRADAANTMSYSVGWLKAVGNEDGTTINVTTSTNEGSVTRCYAIDGANADSAPDISAGWEGSSPNPNPDAVTPVGGSDDYLYFAFAGQWGTRTVSAYPSGYSNTGYSDSNAGGAEENVLAWATKATTSSTTDNPGTFTFSAWTDSMAWTIAVAPESAGGTPMLDDTSPQPTDTINFTCGSAFSGTITTLTSPQGDTVSADSGADTCNASFTIPAITTFVASGAMQNTQWDVSGTWTVGDGSTTENVTMKIDPPAGFFGDIDCSSCPGDSLKPAAGTTGDDYFCRYSSGVGLISDSMVAMATAPEAVIACRIYDESATDWTAIVSTTFESIATLN